MILTPHALLSGLVLLHAVASVPIEPDSLTSDAATIVNAHQIKARHAERAETHHWADGVEYVRVHHHDLDEDEDYALPTSPSPAADSDDADELEAHDGLSERDEVQYEAVHNPDTDEDEDWMLPTAPHVERKEVQYESVHNSNTGEDEDWMLPTSPSPDVDDVEYESVHNADTDEEEDWMLPTVPLLESLANHFATSGEDLTGPDGIAPAPLIKRKAKKAETLYNPKTNEPEIEDIKQKGIGNCGFLAAVAGCLHINKQWITNIISPEKDGKATFSVWNSSTFEHKPISVTKESMKDTRGDASNLWWVGGLEAAVVKNGEGVTVLPHRALTMITGIRSGGTKTRDRNHPSKGLSKKEMYEVMKKAETTPILFQSIKDAKKMAHNHAWAVLRTDTNEEGKEGAWLFNPWGREDFFTVDELYGDIYRLQHLKKFETGPAGGGGGKGVVAEEKPKDNGAPKAEVTTKKAKATPNRKVVVQTIKVTNYVTVTA